MRITAWLIAVAVFMMCLQCSIAWPGCAEEITILPEGPTNAVDLDGDLAAIGNGRLLKIVDLSDPANPVVLGSVTIPGPITAIDLAGDLALIAAEANGMQVVDVSDPARPRLIGELVGEPSVATDVIRFGSFAFYLESIYSINGVGFAFYVVDISEPDEPTVVWAFARYGSAAALASDGDGIVIVADSWAGVFVIDANDPLSPSVVASIGAMDAVDVAISGDILLVAARNGLRVYDVSNPQDPVRLGTIPVEPTAVATDGRYAYTVGNIYPYWDHPGVRVFDLQDPANPRELPGLADDERARDIDLMGDVAVVAAGASGTWILNTSEPSELREHTRLPGLPSARWVVSASTAMVIADRDRGAHPVLIAREPPHAVLASLPIRRVTAKPAIVGDLLFVPTSSTSHEGEIVVVDLSNPSVPREVSRVPVWHPHGVAVVNSALAVITRYGFNVIDITDPENAVVVGSLEMTPDTIAANGSNALVGFHACPYASGMCYDHVNIIDVSSPTAPVEVHEMRIAVPTDIDSHGSTAFMAMGGGLVIVDLHDPSAPDFVWSASFDRGVVSIDLSGSFVFATSQPRVRVGRRGIMQVIDVGDFYQPYIEAHLDTAGGALDVAVIDGVAWIADGDAGLVLADVSSCGIPPPYEADGRAGP